jgi:hypothetical protein
MVSATLLSVAACMREPAGPTWDWDQEADQAEAKAFTERWSALNARNDPPALLARSTLALDALGHGLAYRVPGLSRESLAAQGFQDAQKAAAALPADPRPQRLLAGYLSRSGDVAGAARAACSAADLAPREAGDQEDCGDLLKQAGDGAGAVQRYKAAILASADRRQQFELIHHIEQTSLTPAADLESLPKDLVDQYRAHQSPPPRAPQAAP